MRHVLAGRLITVIIVLTMVIIPGCGGRLANWGKNAIYQGIPVNNKDGIAAVQNSVRSVAVYDQFTTRALFDALLLSDQVRTEYARLRMQRLGKNDDQYNAFLRRQLEENRHYVTFYILSTHEKPLGDASSEWVVLIRVNDKNIIPAEVKSIDIPLEYQLLFGNKYSRFKVGYSVKCAVKDKEDNCIVTPETKQIALVFRSFDKQVELVWDL